MASRGGSAHRANGSRDKICHFKLVLLGESGVGKSCLVLRFVKGEYSDHLEATIGAAFLTQTVNLDDTTVKFEIWDTAGQERYHSLAPMYYRGAQAAVVVYDISDGDTFVRAKNWVKELQRQASPSIVIALAGNKADLKDIRKVHIEVIRLALERLQIFEDKTLYELHEGCPGDEENWTLLKEGETKITTHAQLQPQTIIIQINPRRACAARVTVVVP